MGLLTTNVTEWLKHTRMMLTLSRWIRLFVRISDMLQTLCKQVMQSADDYVMTMAICA